MIHKIKVRNLIRSPSALLALMAALIIAPAAHVHALVPVDEIIPSIPSSQGPIVQTDDTATQTPEPTPDPVPASDNPSGIVIEEDTVPSIPLDLATEEQVLLPVAAVEVAAPITTTVPAPRSIIQPPAPTVRSVQTPPLRGVQSAQASIQRDVTPARAVSTLSPSGVAQPASELLRQPASNVRIAVAEPADVSISAAQPAHLRSDVEYTSNQLAPHLTERYYHAALLAGGLGLVLYGLTFLPRLHILSSFVNRNI